MDELHLRAVINGDERAVRAFVGEYAPVLRAVIRRTVFGPLAAADEEDLLQDLLLGLVSDGARALRRWDPLGGRTLKAYLQEYARLRTMDWLRRRQRRACERPTDDLVLASHADAQGVEPQEPPDWVEPLYQLVASECTPEDLRLLELSYLEEMPTRELANQLGLSEQALYQRRSRLRQRLLKLKQRLIGPGSGADS